MSQRQRLTRIERKVKVFRAVKNLSHFGPYYCTMAEIANYMGLKPSTYVMELLRELETEDKIMHYSDRLVDGRDAIRWCLPIPF